MYHWCLSLYCFPTERGVCLPTVSLWILFVYIEAAIRFKDLKNFHVDLCRPFAAHWWVLCVFLICKSVQCVQCRMVSSIRSFFLELLQEPKRQYNIVVKSREPFHFFRQMSVWTPAPSAKSIVASDLSPSLSLSSLTRVLGTCLVGSWERGNEGICVKYVT